MALIDANITGSKGTDVVTLLNWASISDPAGVTNTMTTSGHGVAILAISGTFTATINFEALGPDGQWYAVNALGRGVGTIATTTTTGGLYEINTRGITQIRPRLSSYTSGSILVKGQAQPISTGAAEFINANITGRKFQTVQTHNAVSILANGYATQTGNWIDCLGYDQIAVSVLNDAASNAYIDIRWSHDGVNSHITESSVASLGTGPTSKAGITPTKARWCKVAVGNLDTTNPHTMSAWAYLKS